MQPLATLNLWMDRVRDRERTHDHGILISLADSASVREDCNLDCPTSDTHAPYLLFHRHYSRTVPSSAPAGR